MYHYSPGLVYDSARWLMSDVCYGKTKILEIQQEATVNSAQLNAFPFLDYTLLNTRVCERTTTKHSKAVQHIRPPSLQVEKRVKTLYSSHNSFCIYENI